MIQPINNDSQTIATAYSITGTGVNVKSAAGASIQSVVTVTTPSAGTFTGFGTVTGSAAALSYAVLGEASKTYATFGKQDASEFYFSIVRTGI